MQQSELEKKIEELKKENKELKESVDTQKASMAASESKLAEMKKTMKIAMQRFTDMKGILNVMYSTKLNACKK